MCIKELLGGSRKAWYYVYGLAYFGASRGEIRWDKNLLHLYANGLKSNKVFVHMCIVVALEMTW